MRVWRFTAIICVVLVPPVVTIIRKCKLGDFGKTEGKCCQGVTIYDNGSYFQQREGKRGCLDVYCIDGELKRGKTCNRPCQVHPCGCKHGEEVYDLDTEIGREEVAGVCEILRCSKEGEIIRDECVHKVIVEECDVDGVKYAKNTDIRKDKVNDGCTVTFCSDTGEVVTVRINCDEEIKDGACYVAGQRYSKANDIDKIEEEEGCYMTFCSDSGELKTTKVDCSDEINTDVCFVNDNRYCKGKIMRRQENDSCYDVYCDDKDALKLGAYYRCEEE